MVIIPLIAVTIIFSLKVLRVFFQAVAPKIYYTAVGKLKKANLVIKQTGKRQYILSNVGKVVWNSLQQIDKSVQLQPALKALDAIH